MLGLSQLFASPEDRPPRSASLSVVSKGMTFRGTAISGTGDLRIEGTVRADISVDGRVYVAPGAEVYGEVRAESILVAGYVEGGLHAAEKLVLTSQAAVSATLEMRTLKIDAGARFEGEVQPHDRDDSESSLSLEEASTSIPSRLVSSSEASQSGTQESSVERASSPVQEDRSPEDEETDAESSVSSSPEDSSPSNASSSKRSEEEGDEPSYGFQW